MSNQNLTRYRFGRFSVSVLKQTLSLEGQELELKRKTFQVLLYLLENPNRPISKEELLKGVWQESFVEESNLAQHIFRLRKAFEVAPEAANYIRTSPGLGYQFTPTVTIETQTLPSPEAASDLASPARRWHPRRLAILALTLIVLATAGFLAWKKLHPARKKRYEIVLADFDNRTGDDTFNTVLKTALAVDLRQSPELTLLRSGNVADTLQSMLRPATEPLKGAVAVEVCRRNNDKAVLSGTISKLDKSYLITLEATDCDSGQTFAALKGHAAGKDDVIETLGKLGSKMRLQLGESLQSIRDFDAPLARATTSSLEALIAFSQGTHQDFGPSIPYFERAIQLDPRFAMAWEDLGVANGEIGNLAVSREAYIKAYGLRDAGSPREKFWLTNRYNLMVLNSLEGARSNFELFVRSYPSDEAAWGELADTLRLMGRYPEALQAAQQAHALGPRNGYASLELAKAYQALGQFENAREVCRQSLALQADNPAMHQILQVNDFALNDQVAYDHELAASKGQEREFQMLTQHAQALSTAGRMREAHRFFDMAREDAADHDVKDFPHIDDAEESLADVLLGQTAAARVLAAKIPSNMEDVSVQAALVAALAGDAAQTEKMVALLLNESTVGSDQIRQYWVPVLHAALALHAGEPARAITLLQPAKIFSAREYWVNTLLGQAYLAVNQPEQAALVYRQILANPGVDPISPMLPLAHLGLARSYVAEGRIGEGRAEYNAFFDAWSAADPELPTLRQARSESTRLKLHI